MSDLKRFKHISFGDPVTNIYTYDGPYHHMRFVELVTKSYKSNYGIRHSTTYAKCKPKGNISAANFDVEAIYLGHLNKAEIKELKEANHGTRSK